MRAINQKFEPAEHLSRADLELLVADDGSDVRRLVAHLERCDACRSRLTDAAASADDWDSARFLLGGDDLPRWEPDPSDGGLTISSSQLISSAIHDQIERLLGTPSHPEMLGRLGRYDIERIIGSGGMGVVLKAHDSELNRPIAIKLLAPELAHNGPARERFAREGRAAAAVVHEHVVAIYNVESGGPVPFLVMQYVPGRSLEARVAEDGPLTVEELLRIGAQAAAGLAAAHRQGLVHRDVKPANILLENSVERAVLTDFGLARAIDDASLTRTGILAGTPHYMSPEQARGELIDHRSDLFSLGAVLYFMATGHPPFRGSTAMGILHRICQELHRPVWQVNKDIPDEVADLIDRLLEKKPGQRFATADDVQDALASLLSRVQRDGLRRRRFRGWSRIVRRKSTIVAAGVAAVVCIAATTWWWKERPGSTNTNTPTAVAAPQVASHDAPANGITDADKHELQLLRADDTYFLTDLASARTQVTTEPLPQYRFGITGDRWQQDLNEASRALDQLETNNGQPTP